MAGSQGPNQLLDLLRALRRRRYQVVVPAVLIATVGIAFAVIVPKRYRVATRIEIKDMRVEPDSQLRNPQNIAVRREAQSVYEHVVNFQRVKDVLESNLAQWPEYVELPSDLERAQFIRERILKSNLSAATTSKELNKGGTIFIDINYTDEDPERASKLLSELSSSWLNEAFDDDRNMLITERNQLQEIMDEQASDLRDKEDRLHALLESLGKDPTINPTTNQRAPGDWAFTALDRAMTSLEEAEYELESTTFELQQARERLAAEPPTELVRTTVEAESHAARLAAMEDRLEKMEAKIANKSPDHSEYKMTKPRIEALRAEIAELAAEEPEATERFITEINPRYEEYENDVRELQDQVGLLTKQRDALITRVKELETETSSRAARYQQLDEMRDQVDQARLAKNETQREYWETDKALKLFDNSPRPWRVVAPPLPASAATQPNPYLLSAVAVFLGLAVGIGTALLSELARSCYRSAGELSVVLSVPVLGAVDTIVTRRERRKLQLSHAMAGLSTAVIVGTIGWMTWLWYASPERLPLEVQDAIERLRSALK